MELDQAVELLKKIVKNNSTNDSNHLDLGLVANDQREVIEQLLGITLLSEKAELLKAQVKEVKDQIQAETFKIDSIRSSNEKVVAICESHLRLRSGNAADFQRNGSPATSWENG